LARSRLPPVPEDSVRPAASFLTAARIPDGLLDNEDEVSLNFRKNLLQFFRTLLEESQPVVEIGVQSAWFERIPRGRVGSSRPIVRRKIVLE
jgi:hypothetical protein